MRTTRRSRPPTATTAVLVAASLALVVGLLLSPTSASAQINPGLDLLPDGTTTTSTVDDGGRDGEGDGPTSTTSDLSIDPGSATLPGPASNGGGGSNTGAILGGLVAGVLLGGLGGFFLARASRSAGDGPPVAVPPPPVQPPATVPGPAVDESVRQAYEAQVATHAGQARQASAERGALVAALLEVVDTSTSDAVRTQVAERLAAVAVLPFEVPAGSPFDPAVHRGVQSAAAPSADHHNLVASTDRQGWADRGVVLRQPEVIVYRWESE